MLLWRDILCKERLETRVRCSSGGTFCVKKGWKLDLDALVGGHFV